MWYSYFIDENWANHSTFKPKSQQLSGKIGHWNQLSEPCLRLLQATSSCAQRLRLGSVRRSPKIKMRGSYLGGEPRKTQIREGRSETEKGRRSLNHHHCGAFGLHAHQAAGGAYITSY